MHPGLKMPADAERFISDVQERVPEQIWKQIGDPNRKSQDAWDARIRRVTDQAELQTEMDSLAQRFAEEEKSSILENYAFVPAHPKPVSYITSMFLHTGWLHLIGKHVASLASWLYPRGSLGSCDLPHFLSSCGSRCVSIPRFVPSRKPRSCPRCVWGNRGTDGWIPDPLPKTENRDDVVHADFPSSV
jgi:hypothetical protein